MKNTKGNLCWLPFVKDIKYQSSYPHLEVPQDVQIKHPSW